MFLTSCTKPFTEKDNGITINLGIDDPFEIEIVAGIMVCAFIYEFSLKSIYSLKAAKTQGLYILQFNSLRLGVFAWNLIFVVFRQVSYI